jgi:hypothetical protein
MTDTTYKSTITEITVHDASRNVLTDFEATVIKLADEGGGHYITIIQGENEIRLDLNELPSVIEAIDRLMMQYMTEDSPKQEQSDDEHVLAVGQRWRRGDGKVVEVKHLGEILGGKEAYRVGPIDARIEDCWFYLPNEECNNLNRERPDLVLVELLQL